SPSRGIPSCHCCSSSCTAPCYSARRGRSRSSWGWRSWSWRLLTRWAELRSHVRWSIENHLGPLEGDQPPADHVVQVGEDPLNRLLGLYHLDDERQVEGEAQHLLGVHDARGAEPGHPTDHRRAGEPLLAELLEQRLVQRLAVVFVALADEDAPQRALAFESVGHGCLAFSCVIRRPSSVGPDRSRTYGCRTADDASTA